MASSLRERATRAFIALNFAVMTGVSLYVGGSIMIDTYRLHTLPGDPTTAIVTDVSRSNSRRSADTFRYEVTYDDGTTQRIAPPYFTLFSSVNEGDTVIIYQDSEDPNNAMIVEGPLDWLAMYFEGAFMILIGGMFVVFAIMIFKNKRLSYAKT